MLSGLTERPVPGFFHLSESLAAVSHQSKAKALTT